MTEDISEKAVYRVQIKAPIEKVWSELVKTDEVLPFFFGAVCNTEDGLKGAQKLPFAPKITNIPVLWVKFSNLIRPTVIPIRLNSPIWMIPIVPLSMILLKKMVG